MWTGIAEELVCLADDLFTIRRDHAVDESVFVILKQYVKIARSIELRLDGIRTERHYFTEGEHPKDFPVVRVGHARIELVLFRQARDLQNVLPNFRRRLP